MVLKRVLFILSLVILAAGTNVEAPRAQTSTSSSSSANASFVAADFFLRMARIKEDGSYSVLSSEAAENHLNQARCVCGEPVEIQVVVEPSGIEKLKNESLEATLLFGTDCNDVDADCVQLGEATLKSDTVSFAKTTGVDVLFSTASSASAKACEPLEATRALWLVLRRDGKRLDVSVSKRLRLDSKPPASPTLTTLLPGDQALHLTWQAPPKGSSVVAYQALCSPGPAQAAETASVNTCQAAGSTTQEASTEAPWVPCSGRLTAASTSNRIEGLQNGHSYAVALVAIDASGNVSAPSPPLSAIPLPSADFFDTYHDGGGQAMSGCQVGATKGGSAGGGGVALFIALLWLQRRLRGAWKHILSAMALAALCLYPPAVHAQEIFEGEVSATPASDREAKGTARRYALSLGVGFYRPGVDREFAGTAPGPFETTFSSARKPLWQMRLERFVWQGFGTLAVGVGVGHYKVTDKAFIAGTHTRSANDTHLRVIPLSLELVYRLDPWRHRALGLVPYARAGLDRHLWFTNDNTSTVSGSTGGWHAAAGLAFDIGSLDPEAALQLDMESGVNHTLIFVELNRADISGFGGPGKLNLSDTTFTLGLSLVM